MAEKTNRTFGVFDFGPSFDLDDWDQSMPAQLASEKGAVWLLLASR